MLAQLSYGEQDAEEERKIRKLAATLPVTESSEPVSSPAVGKDYASPGSPRRSAAARLRQKTPERKSKYDRRAGIEGTFSRAVSLEHVLTIVALNVLRVMEWLGGIVPPKGRISAFATLAA